VILMFCEHSCLNARGKAGDLDKMKLVRLAECQNSIELIVLKNRRGAGRHGHDLLRNQGERHHWTGEASMKDIIVRMVAGGCSVELIADVALVLGAAQAERDQRHARAAEKREKGRVRQAHYRSRMSRVTDVTTRDIA
jgi:hypothetical protein